jgi:hypothetical protein
MASHDNRWHQALAGRLLSLTKAVNTTPVSVTRSGYTRATGSFLEDGFAPGDEVTATEFALRSNNTSGVVSSVTDTLLQLRDVTLATEAVGVGILGVRTPSRVAWEGTEFDPEVGWPYLRESYRPGTRTVRSLGTKALLRHEIIWLVDCFYPALGKGTTGINGMAQAVMDKYPPGLQVTHDMYVRTSYPFGVLTKDGWQHIPVTIRLTAHTTNSI